MNIYWRENILAEMAGRVEFEHSKLEELIRLTLEELIGSTSLSVFEYHLSKKFNGESPYKVFWNSPNKFYEALKELFGPGADIFLKIIAQKLAVRGCLTVKPKEFVTLFKKEKVHMLTKVISLHKKHFDEK